MRNLTNRSLDINKNMDLTQPTRMEVYKQEKGDTSDIIAAATAHKKRKNDGRYEEQSDEIDTRFGALAPSSSSGGTRRL